MASFTNWAVLRHRCFKGNRFDFEVLRGTSRWAIGSENIRSLADRPAEWDSASNSDDLAGKTWGIRRAALAWTEIVQWGREGRKEQGRQILRKRCDYWLDL